MKNIKKLTLLLFFIELTSCGTNTDGEVEGESPHRPANINISIDNDTTWRGLCHRLEVGLVTTSNTPTGAGRLRTIELSTDLGALYSNISCTTPKSSHTLNTDDQDFTVYFRSPTVGTATIKASSSGLTEGTVEMTVTQPTAELVLGQALMTTNSSNNPALGAQGMNNPFSTVVAGGKMFVSDYVNNRVLIWNTIPTNNHQAADVVLGQPNMTTDDACAGGPTAQALCNPSFVHSDGTRLVVADESNSRVLIWNTIPTVNYQAADVVLGQADMDSNVDGSVSPGADTLAYPGAVYILGTKLFVVDTFNNRVLIWHTIPTVNQTPAQTVVGQPNMTSNGSATSSTGLNTPYMITVHGSRMFVSDYGNNRVLIWNSIPLTDGVAANVVVGQPDFTTATANTGGVSAASLSLAGSAVVDEQGRFYIPDYSNHRILVWNHIPTSNHQAADAVIGQADFTTVTSNTGGVSATSLFNPWGLFIRDGKLWAADTSNHRVLKFTIPY